MLHCAFPFTPAPYSVQAVPESCSFLVSLLWVPSAHFPVSPLQRERRCILLRTGQPPSQHGLAALFQSTEHLEDICNFTPTGGYNSLLAESKSTRCQRIPETICMVVKSKNKMKSFCSHLALPHTQMYPQLPLE